VVPFWTRYKPDYDPAGRSIHVTPPAPPGCDPCAKITPPEPDAIAAMTASAPKPGSPGSGLPTRPRYVVLTK